MSDTAILFAKPGVVRPSDKGARNPGMQARNHDRHANPLCRHHHQHDQHTRRERDFWADAGLNAYDNAARLFAEYRREG